MRSGCSRRGIAQNLLSPMWIDVGVAVVAARGVLYAVADYSRGVQQLSARAGGGASCGADSRERRNDSCAIRALARAACADQRGRAARQSGALPRFVMRWQAADLTDCRRR